MDAAVIIAIINSGDGLGLAGPKEALFAGGCDLLSRRLAIRGGVGCIAIGGIYSMKNAWDDLPSIYVDLSPRLVCGFEESLSDD